MSAPHIPAPVLAGYSALREGCALCYGGGAWPGQPGLIELSGADRLEWLQGQATNDVSVLTADRPVDFCLCAPTGQILAPCRAWALEDRIVIEAPLECVSAFLERATLMVVMEDVEARDLSREMGLISLQGPQAAAALQARCTPLGETIALPSDHCGSGGMDLWVPMNAFDDCRRAFSDLPEVPVESLEIARIEAGIPIFGIDLSEKTLPPELGPAFEAQNVSYTKGCYVGQEIVHRIHARGHTNKTWSGLLLESPVEPNSTVAALGRDDAGRVTSAVVSPRFGPIATAVMRNEAAIDGLELGVLSGGPNVKGRVKTLPFLR